MKALAVLIGLLICIMGVLGLASPGALVAVTRPWVTPTGLWLAGALRVAIGLVLLRVAPGSRYPTALRVLGVIVIAAGLVTPLYGAERSQAIFAWWAAQEHGFVRVWGVFALALGGFILYAVAPARRRAR